MFETILVPLDGSALAEASLHKAIEIASDTGARVVLLRAVQAHVFPGGDQTEAQVHVVREAEEYLEQVAGRLRTAGVTRVDASVWYGPADFAILEGAKLRKADLIVMSTHGRSGLGRLILGSVAESVLRGTTIPILVVRPREAPIEAPGARGGAIPWEATGPGARAGR